jgi:hypothetical protein
MYAGPDHPEPSYAVKMEVVAKTVIEKDSRPRGF